MMGRGLQAFRRPVDADSLRGASLFRERCCVVHSDGAVKAGQHTGVVSQDLRRAPGLSVSRQYLPEPGKIDAVRGGYLINNRGLRSL